MKLIQNGIKQAANGKRKRRKRNGTTTPSVGTTPRKRNGVTKASAMSFAKKNGLKLVSKTISNGKRKRRKRNGVATVTRTRSNGLFGKTTSDFKKVGALTGGAIATNVGGNWLASLISPYLASFGLGNYTNIITQAMIALFGVPYLAKALKQDTEMARLGGLLSVTLEVLSMFFPQFNSLNPFNSSAMVINPNGQVALTGDAVKQIAAAAANETASKVAGFTEQLNAMSAGSGWNSTNPYENAQVM